MTLVTSLRIDIAIQTASRSRWLLYVSLMVIMMVLAWLASLLWWQYVLILVVSVTVASYLIMSRPTPLHISQPPLRQRLDRQWQLLIRTDRGDELWHAQLLTIHRYPRVIIINFKITEPYQKPLSMTIFRDQVNSEDWRALNVLANTVTEKTQ